MTIAQGEACLVKAMLIVDTVQPIDAVMIRKKPSLREKGNVIGQLFAGFEPPEPEEPLQKKPRIETRVPMTPSSEPKALSGES
jgi:hypothetical protein